MEKYELQRLRDLPIEEVAGRLGMEVVRHKALCPFHDDHHASLSFSPGRNTYRCFACGAHGGVIDLVMNRLGKGFREACEWLGATPSPRSPRGGRASYPLVVGSGEDERKGLPSPSGEAGRGVAQRYARFFEHPFLLDEARRFLFGERRLDERVVRWCRLTSWRDRQGVPWLQIPYYDREGRLTGVQNRNLVPGALPRFRFPRGSRCGIYNLPVLARLRPGDELWITEGPSDCWAMLSAGRKAIAIPSATLLTREDREQLSIINSQLSIQPHMYPDHDLPGERLFLSLREVLPGLVRHQLPPGCKDFGEWYVKSKIQNKEIQNKEIQN